jgi:RNA polymerase sigma factor (sigma-70 family)
VRGVEQGVTAAAEPLPAVVAAHVTGDVPVAEPLAAAASATADRTGTRFEDRFDELASIAYRVSFRLLGSRQDAEDLTQETLTRAYQRWRKVRGHAEPWVARVAANLALDAIRSGKRRPTVDAPDLDDRPSPETASPVDRLDLVRGLQGLPRRQREVVVLRYLADLSEADAAAELGISVGSVKKHASRGIAALRLSQQPEQQGDQ